MGPYSNGELAQMEQAGRNAERCVCCGAVIPEGRQVCPICETRKCDSPVTMIFHEMQTKMEHGVVEAFQQIDINIDKAGVIRALEAYRMRRAGELVKVVRCKDCEWSEKKQDGFYTCHLLLAKVHHDDYCAWAERKEKTDGHS